MAEGGEEKPIVVYAAAAANLGIAVAKFVAAAFTGSSSMLSEGIHSVVDTGNEVLLLVGLRRSRRPPDRAHPFGHGKALYFWGLMVAMVIFGVGGGMSFYEGLTHLRRGENAASPAWNYGVLGVALVLEGLSFRVALRKFREGTLGRPLWRSFRASKDPSLFIVLAEDLAALVGLGIAFLGVLLSHLTGNHVFDGIASLLIGVLLSAVALLLGRETGGLLLGESASAELVQKIDSVVRTDPAVERSGRPLTMQLGPSEVLVNVAVAFRQELSREALEDAAERLEHLIQEVHPTIQRVFIALEPLAKLQPREPAPA